MRQTNCKKFPKLGSILEQWPCLVYRATIQNDFQRTIQKNRISQVANQVAVVLLHKGTSSQSNDTVNSLLQAREGISFHFAKLGFSLMHKDFSNRLVMLFFYFLIQVDELPT